MNSHHTHAVVPARRRLSPRALAADGTSCHSDSPPPPRAATPSRGRGKYELPPGDYKVVVNAGDVSLTVPATLALRQDVTLKVGINDDTLVVEK